MSSHRSPPRGATVNSSGLYVRNNAIVWTALPSLYTAVSLQITRMLMDSLLDPLLNECDAFIGMQKTIILQKSLILQSPLHPHTMFSVHAWADSSSSTSEHAAVALACCSRLHSGRPFTYCRKDKLTATAALLSLPPHPPFLLHTQALCCLAVAGCSFAMS